MPATPAASQALRCDRAVAGTPVATWISRSTLKIRGHGSTWGVGGAQRGGRKATQMATILVVDDDPQVRDALSIALPFQWEAATVVTASDGDQVMQVFFDENPDLILLDVSLPGLSGFEVLQRIRRVSDVPVIMLTALGDEKDQVQGLALGADDYIIKPCSAIVLLARIRAVLRRTELTSPSRSAPDFVDGPLTIRYQSRQVFVHRRPIRLTPVEFK